MSSDVYESFINTIRAEAWDEGWEARDCDEFGGSLTVEQRANPYRNKVSE